MNQHLGIGLAALALAAALSGCGGSPGTTTATTTSTAATSAPPGVAPTAGTAAPGTSAPSVAPPTAAAAVDLKTASSSAGDIVVDANGMSVYFFTNDVKDSGSSACTGACLTAWPPVLSTAPAPAADGVTGTLGTTMTPDGAKQLTLNGLPLYYFAQDKEPGDVLGQGVNGVWYLASPAGEMIRTAGSGY